MNFFSIRKLIMIGAATLTLSAVPATASAGGKVYLDFPSFSIGYYDSHYDRKRYRKHRRHHKRAKRYYRNHYRDHYYDYQPRRYYYYDDSYRSRRYDRPRYRDDYEYCPTPGFSLRYYRNRGCYSHGDHYHCDG